MWATHFSFHSFPRKLQTEPNLFYGGGGGNHVLSALLFFEFHLLIRTFFSVSDFLSEIFFLFGGNGRFLFDGL